MMPQVKRFALSTSEWTPIVTPIACNYFAILGSSDGAAMSRCSTPSSEQSWSDWYDLQDYALVVPRMGERRFEPGDTVTYLKGKTPGQSAIVEFIL